MNLEQQLKELVEKTKAGMTVEINQHKCYYESVEKFLAEDKDEIIEQFGRKVWDKMVETDTIVDLHFYKDTPVGFLKVWHHDLEEAINIMYQWYDN